MSDGNKSHNSKDKRKHNSSMPLIKRILRDYMRPYTRRMCWSIFFMVIAAAMTAMFAKLVQPVLDDVLINAKKDLIVPIALSVFACFSLRGVATYMHTVMTNTIGQSIVSDIQKDLFAHSLKLDLKFFQENPSGEMVARMISDVNVMRAAVAEAVTGLFKNFLTLILLIVVMFYQDWVLALAAFTIFPFAAAFVAWLGKRLRKISGRTQESIGSMASFLSQVFQGIRQVKAYGQETEENRRAALAIDRVRDLNIKNTTTGNLSTPVNDVLVGLTVLGLIIYGGYQSVAGALTPGSLMSFIAAFLMAYEPMKKLAKLNNNLQTGLGAAERVFAILDIRPAIITTEATRSLESKAPVIAFENVCFAYDTMGGDDAGLRVLDDVSFTAKNGEVIALVGPSGAGKSTILNLVLRFFDPVSGRVTIDGSDIRDYTLESLRGHMALVSQEVVIFDDTVLANIAYGDPSAGEDRVIEAAKAANAHEFIMAMEEGYQTRVGENGLKLSGGQRQRIAIARAILRNAPILLLDEATSALDNESERLIQQSLQKLEQGRTTIVIAHRLSTIRSATRILVMDAGRIAESGTHAELIALGGIYASLYTDYAHG